MAHEHKQGIHPAGGGLFSWIILLVLTFGGARLSFFSPEAKTICVASITKPHHLPLFFDLEGERNSICKNSREEQEVFLEKSRLAARRGAKTVTWQDRAVFLFEEDEADFVERARDIVQQEQVNIVMAYNTYPDGFPDQPWKNKFTGIILLPLRGLQPRHFPSAQGPPLPRLTMRMLRRELRFFDFTNRGQKHSTP